jgi:hypothetical protein
VHEAQGYDRNSRWNPKRVAAAWRQRRAGGITSRPMPSPGITAIVYDRGAMGVDRSNGLEIWETTDTYGH